MLNEPKNSVLVNDTEKNKSFISDFSYKKSETKPSIKTVRKKNRNFTRFTNVFLVTSSLGIVGGASYLTWYLVNSSPENASYSPPENTPPRPPRPSPPPPLPSPPLPSPPPPSPSPLP